jgi:putative ABC transport system substrate-binding protein
MKRRDFIVGAGAAVTRPLAARAQVRGGLPRVGVLTSLEPRLHALRQGLQAQGLIDGKNIALDLKMGSPDRFGDWAAELVSRPVDVIVAQGSQAIEAAQRATRSIPIVMSGSSNPVGDGFVTSLSHPGGNITGVSFLNAELNGKRLTLLKAVVPTARRVTLFWDPNDPSAVHSLKETEAVAPGMGIEVHSAEVRSLSEIDAELRAALAPRADAIVLLPAPIMASAANRIAEFTTANRLPVLSFSRETVAAGGLISYGPDIDAVVRRSAAYVAKILRGAKPGDLPVEQPTKFDLVINLKTAKALGLTMPASLLATADEVIE